MGEGIILPDRVDALRIAAHLNAMFSEEGFKHTKTRYHALKSNYPALLDHKRGEGAGPNRRQRSLRHFAWLTTADIDFKNTVKPYPAQKFRLWLRWLTWLERDPPADSVVKVNSVISTETPAEAILKTLRHAFNRDHDFSVNPTIDFEWVQSTAPPHLTVEVKRSNPYTIKVTSWNESQVPNTIDGNEDDEYEPAPAPKA